MKTSVSLPDAMKDLPVAKAGYVKPWFVRADDFREIDERKFFLAMQKKRCWICGKPNHKFQTFVSGPKSAYHGVSSEPPCHPDCATYALKVCPYIINPTAGRNLKNLPESIKEQSALQDMKHPGYYVETAVRKFEMRNIADELFAAVWKPEWVKYQSIWYQGELMITSPEPLGQRFLENYIRG